MEINNCPNFKAECTQK